MDAEQQHEVYLGRKLASEDLALIEALRAQPATEKYLLRRVREIRDGHAAAVLDDDSLSGEEREIRRRLYRAFREFAAILDTDEREHRETLKDSGTARR